MLCLVSATSDTLTLTNLYNTQVFIDTDTGDVFPTIFAKTQILPNMQKHINIVNKPLLTGEKPMPYHARYLFKFTYTK